MAANKSPLDLYMLGDLPMDNKDMKNAIGTICVDKDGTQYFVIGKIRIKVSEHFANNGKPFVHLMEDVIQHAAVAG